jgi:aryl-alcohol dehydrogenase-like predicted oxidoreductase
MTIDGGATLDGTTRYRARFKDAASHHFRLEDDLWLSSIGIGTYLGGYDEATDLHYTDAIIRAVELGANVIDTAINYRCQRSERAIGAALRALSERGYGRDELLICTKGGYLPFDGAPPTDLRRYVTDTFVTPGIAGPQDFAGGSHCMTPAYLQHQLDCSLANLGLSQIDVYYIHNPESQLAFISHDEFYARLRSAFSQLESAIRQHKIGSYGVATWNGFRVDPEAREYHSLERMMAEARAAGGESNGFRFVQLPFNLAMPEAFQLENQTVNGRQVSMLEAAEALSLTVVASASMLQGRVAEGLPDDIREPLGSLATDAQTGIQFVRSTPGITTALVGMSQREHVAENLQLARVEPLHPEEFIRAFAG